MAAMIGKWICCPELTTGFEEFMTAIGTPEEERKQTENIAFTLEISRDGDTWKVAMVYPGIEALSRTYEFKSGVETEFPGRAPGRSTKSVVDVGEDVMKSKIQSIVDGEVKREWETTSRIEGDYLLYKSMYDGKEMVQKLKKM